MNFGGVGKEGNWHFSRLTGRCMEVEVEGRLARRLRFAICRSRSMLGRLVGTSTRRRYGWMCIYFSLEDEEQVSTQTISLLLGVAMLLDAGQARHMYEF